MSRETAAPDWRLHASPQVKVAAFVPPPHLVRILKAMPSELRDSFTLEQLRAISAATKAPNGHHWVDVRASIPVPGRRIYLNLQIGRERRSMARLRDEGQVDGMLTVIIYIVATMIFLSLLATGVLTTLYVGNAVLGFDALDQSPALRDLLEGLR